MSDRYRVVYNDTEAAQVDAIAREYRLTETEVIHQLIEIGLEQCRSGSRLA